MDEKFIDKFTDIDNILKDELLPVLKKLQTGEITVQLPEGHEGQETVSDLLELLKYQHSKDYEIHFFTYPADGTRASLVAGTTTLDYNGGTIKSPSGAVTKMTTSLAKQNKDFLRSCAINCDKDIVIQLDNKNKTPVKADTWFVMTYQQFTKLLITTTSTTSVFALACTNPKAVLEMVGESTVSVGREERNQIKSLIGTHFTGVLAQWASEEENLTGIDDNEVTITGISVYAEQALNIRVWLFETDGFQESTAADMDDDEFVEFVDIDLSTSGKRYKNTGGYYYALTGLEIDYEDIDASKELHVAIENIGATGKLASGSGGNIWIKASYIPRT